MLIKMIPLSLKLSLALKCGTELPGKILVLFKSIIKFNRISYYTRTGSNLFHEETVLTLVMVSTKTGLC